MSNNSWVSFGKDFQPDESTFNKPIAGASLSKGRHQNVKIQSVAPGPTKNVPSAEIIFEKDGETKKSILFLQNYEKDGFSRDYLALVQSVSSDIVSRKELFMDRMLEDPSVLKYLIGSYVNIKIDYKKVREPGKKFKLVNIGDMGYKFVDAFDDESGPEELENNAFETYEDAKDAAEEHELQLHYLNVISFARPSDKELLDEQTSRLQDIASKGGSAKASRGTTGDSF